MTRIPTLLALLAGLLLAGAGQAQLLPGLPALSRLPQATASLQDTVDDARGDVRQLSGARALDVAALLRAHRRELDTDARGAVVVRGEIVAIDPNPVALQALRQAGFASARNACWIRCRCAWCRWARRRAAIRAPRLPWRNRSIRAAATISTTCPGARPRPRR